MRFLAIVFLQKQKKPGKIGNVNRWLLNIKAGLVDFAALCRYHRPIEMTEEQA